MIAFHGQTDVGKRRSLNEDTIFTSEHLFANMLPDRRLLKLVAAHGPDLASACQALVTEANTQGGRDNISAILVRYTA